MRNTLTTGISLLTGLLLLAGCSGGQTGQAAQDSSDNDTSTPTSTNSGTGVSLPERTEPAKSLDLADPCDIITKQQQRHLGADQPPENTNIGGIQGCKYQKGDAGTKGGWFIFVAADPSQTTQDFTKNHPGGKATEISNYPSYQVPTNPGCLISVDISNSGSLFLNGRLRYSAEKNESCTVHADFAEAAIKNLPNA